MPDRPDDVSGPPAGKPSGPSGWVLGGRYRILDRLGDGGMAEVFRAHDELLDRDVAVKVFRSVPTGGANGDSNGDVRRELELQALARLSHPNLITLFDGSLAKGAPAYLVLELVPGIDLSTRLADGPLSEAEARLIGEQIADALAYVHSQGLVHRDVKPANILLGADLGPDGPIRARLSDFGIVRMIGADRMTSADLTLGTATYLAPEQARGADVEPAADIYSLGLVLIEALTGKKCFDGPMHEAMAARLAVSPEVPAGLPQPWPGLLAAMTAMDPADRVTAAQVSQSLREGSPVSAVLPIAGATSGVLAATDTTGPLPLSSDTGSPLRTGALPLAGVAAVAADASVGNAVSATSATGAIRVAPLPVDEDPPAYDREKERRGSGLLFALGAIAFAALLAGAGWLLLGGSGGSPASETTNPPSVHRSAPPAKRHSSTAAVVGVHPSTSAERTRATQSRTRTTTTRAAPPPAPTSSAVQPSTSSAPASSSSAVTSTTPSPSVSNTPSTSSSVVSAPSPTTT